MKVSWASDHVAAPLNLPRWPLPRHKVEQIRAELQKGTGILKTARLVGTGVSAVQRIKAAMLPAP
jgi:hypothetical protein